MTAKAVLISINFDDEKIVAADFFEGEGAILKAQGVEKGLKADWPNCIFVVKGNEEASEDFQKYIDEEIFGLTSEGC